MRPSRPRSTQINGTTHLNLSPLRANRKPRLSRLLQPHKSSLIMASAFETVADAFLNFYYQSFDGPRHELAMVYRDQSMLSYEGGGVMGAAAIMEKLQNLNFGQIQHRRDTTDVQPVGDDAIIIMVTGALIIQGEERPTGFSQTFHLKNEIDANGGSNWWIFNEIFRLNFPVA
ncbi:NTF2-like protein [Ophiobolus disseminans]|uniref:Nuclear transport factor 2 n=1 Tax=Ophiobolus disseminans TaxID=1469910 RepID=A0A6A6ZEF5_9PLEO|nr:NTF2-like protein [Ophiobolus disseminans]